MPPKSFFPKVKEAREALAAKATTILEQYLAVVKAAADTGNYDVATKSLQWLMEHMPDDPDGRTMVDTSIDKNAISSGPTAPAIQIGISMGANQTKALPPSVIDVTPENHDSDKKLNEPD